jgi:RND family efflux transporter MFP subunit
MTQPPKHPWIRLLTRFAVGVAAVVVGVVVFLYLVKTEPHLEQVDRTQIAPQVQVMRVEAMPIRRQWRGFGTAAAMDSINVPARVVTTVAQVPPAVVAGARVAKGDLLARLDDADFQQQMQSAAANVADLEAQLRQLEIERKHMRDMLALANEDVAIAESELVRVDRMFESGAGSTQDRDATRRILLGARRTHVTINQQLEQIDDRAAALRARRDAQQAAYEQAKLAVERCTIASPLDGAIEQVHIENGEHVANGQILARIVNLERIEVPVRLPTAARQSVQPGDAVELRATNDSALRWNAQIARISPTDDAQTRTVTVYAELRQTAQSDRPLSPGQFVTAVVTTGRAEPRWLVPERALRSNRLLLVEGDAVTSRSVEVEFLIEQQLPQTGLPDNQWAALRTPLAGGDLVIVNPSQSIVDGKQVEPVIARQGVISASGDDAEPGG